jgi:hypothetical protein
MGSFPFRFITKYQMSVNWQQGPKSNTRFLPILSSFHIFLSIFSLITETSSFLLNSTLKIKKNFHQKFHPWVHHSINCCLLPLKRSQFVSRSIHFISFFSSFFLLIEQNKKFPEIRNSSRRGCAFLFWTSNDTAVSIQLYAARHPNK